MDVARRDRMYDRLVVHRCGSRLGLDYVRGSLRMFVLVHLGGVYVRLLYVVELVVVMVQVLVVVLLDVQEDSILRLRI